MTQKFTHMYIMSLCICVFFQKKWNSNVWIWTSQIKASMELGFRLTFFVIKLTKKHVRFSPCKRHLQRSASKRLDQTLVVIQRRASNARSPHIWTFANQNQRWGRFANARTAITQVPSSWMEDAISGLQRWSCNATCMVLWPVDLAGGRCWNLVYFGTAQ